MIWQKHVRTFTYLRLPACLLLQHAWRSNEGSIWFILFFPFPFFSTVISFDFDMMNQTFSPPKTLLHCIMETRWVFCQHFTRLLFITFVKMDSIVLLQKTELNTDLLIVQLNWGIPSSKGVVARCLICKWPIGFYILSPFFQIWRVKMMTLVTRSLLLRRRQ